MKRATKKLEVMAREAYETYEPDRDAYSSWQWPNLDDGEKERWFAVVRPALDSDARQAAELRRLRAAVRQFVRLVDSQQYVYLLKDALKPARRKP